jgi:hypothetical protein
VRSQNKGPKIRTITQNEGAYDKGKSPKEGFSLTLKDSLRLLLWGVLQVEFFLSVLCSYCGLEDW